MTDYAVKILKCCLYIYHCFETENNLFLELKGFLRNFTIKKKTKTASQTIQIQLKTKYIYIILKKKYKKIMKENQLLSLN